jgi:uncharacterized membrane protein YeaQ/YmgE (transglycosylase-associated protein family)
MLRHVIRGGTKHGGRSDSFRLRAGKDFGTLPSSTEAGMRIIWFLIIGIVAGWAAGKVMRGRGFGLLGDLAVGIVGAIIGGFIFRLLGMVGASLLAELVTAFIGAVILLWLISTIKR